MLAVGSPLPHSRSPGSLPGGIDVQLTLQDIVYDGLIQVVHHVAVAMLQGQSEGGGAKGEFSLYETLRTSMCLQTLTFHRLRHITMPRGFCLLPPSLLRCDWLGCARGVSRRGTGPCLKFDWLTHESNVRLWCLRF